MKNMNNPFNTVLLTGPAVIVVMATICAPIIRAADQPLTPEAGAARMEAARTEIAITRTNIVQTLEQLDQIRSAADPHAQFQKFTAQLTRMEERAQLARERAQAMKTRADAYFADWEAQIGGIQDVERRKQVEASYAKRKKSYDRITRFMQQAGKDFKPLLSSLTEIKTLLEGERSQEKVAAAKNLFRRANWDCTDVQRSLMEAEREFDNLAADFSGNSATASPARKP
jgi:Protein of unknown function (DUF2959)